MRIHSLVIDNFRAIEHLEISDLPERGVVIIHGCNEAGKSTILDALDLVLRERHSAGGKKIKVFAPAGRDASPEVTLHATVGEYTFTIRKRWLKGKLAELTVSAPTRANYTGREADDVLERILAEHMDTDLAQMLFLRQGELEPGIAAAGIPSISRALEAQSGGETAGEEDTALMQAVETEYAKYFTAAQPPKKKASFEAKFTAVQTAQAKQDEAERTVAQLADYVDEVERKKEEISRAEADLPQAKEELAARETAFTEAAQLKEQAERAAEQHARTAETLKRAEQDAAAREEQAERVATLRAEEETLTQQLEPAEEARDAEALRYNEHSQAVAEAKKKVAAARARVKQSQAASDYIRAAARLKALGDQLDRIAVAEQRYADLLKDTPREVSDKDVRALEQAESEVALQRRLRDAASAKLEITAESARITVDGEEVGIDGTETVPVFDGTQLRLGEFELVFRAATGAEDPRAAVERAEDALAELLDRTGCDTVEAARTARDAYATHAAEVKAAKQRRDDALAGADAEALRAEHERLSSGLDELRSAAELTEAEAGELDEQAADAALRAAQEELEAAERAVDAAEADLKPYAEKSAERKLEVLRVQAESKRAETDEAAAKLAQAEENTPTTSLAAAVEAARAEEAEAGERLNDLQAKVEETDPALAQQLLSGAKARLHNVEERKRKAEDRVRELSGYIDLASGAAERADRAAADLQAAESELERTTRRAEAARLLYDTMRAHRDAARARYSAPFNEAIRNRARVLFGPSVDFNLSDDLTISDRTVDGVTVPLTELSGGTKEQLALLTRFAIADLVTESGDTSPVPVVVDDALGATDPDRLALMNSLFNQVGQQAQVLVLTCFPQRFDRVAAAKTVDIDELKQSSLHERLSDRTL